ncbi:hypothetical protein [Bradyrhizobium stylosanthis]|uniref:Uncharacterized protein n=1 Tax=Bradyrhizobium stylosanthis TaxID=1803665 RepID=A0A560CXG4_9BRAD|nr:hypothetical protein [Bradyrhizobium stylosanthis]TWA89547.1 hypothetical protein FBZ96_11915 [Bradyrhizobium stylosanthis]
MPLVPLVKLTDIQAAAEELKNLRSEISSVKSSRKQSIELVVDPDYLEIRTSLPRQIVLNAMAEGEKAIVAKLATFGVEVD